VATGPSADELARLNSVAEDIEIATIIVDGRIRRDFSHVPALAESIKENGLIQPVVLTHDRKLIAGESRIRACKSLGLSHIRAVFRGVLDEAQLHILECEENNARKDLTWQERCLSIDRTHRYKSTEAIMRGQKWGVRETGDLLKQGKTNIAYAVAISDELHANNKEVWAAETMMDAWKVVLSQREKEALKLIVTNATNKAAAAKSPTAPKGPIIPDVAFFDPTADTSIALFTPGVAGPSDTGEMPGDAAAQGPMQVPLSHMLLKENEHGTLFRMCELGADAVDHIITDPPYAIDMDNLAQEQGGKEDVDSVRKEHDVDENLDLLERFVKQSYITLRDRGFLVMWCDPTMWLMLNTLCNDTGFRVQRWPLVWHKTSACSNQSASTNFTKNIEFAVVARKGNATLLSQQPSCVYTGGSDIETRLLGHPFAKPSGLWTWLYRGICQRGQVVLDPFVGVGSSYIPAVQYGLNPIGIECADLHFGRLQVNVQNLYKSLDKDCIFT
jgi:hypothetical protein